MKTSNIAILLLGYSLTVFGQGQVQFRNCGLTNDGRVFLASGGLFIQYLDGSNPLWRAALLGGPVTGAPAYIPYPAPLSGTGRRGNLAMLHHPTTTTLRWVNFQRPPSGTPGCVNVTQVAREVPGVDWGGTALIQMVAWQGNYTNWDDAWDAAVAGAGDVCIGCSTPLTLRLPAGPTDPNAAYLWGLNSFPIIGCTYVPVLMAQPVSQVVNVGDPIQFSFRVYGNCESLSYQWFHNGRPIPGSDGPEYGILSVQAGDAGNYSAVVRGSYGSASSDEATLTVRAPPIIISQPQTQTAVVGSAATLKVGATGDAPLSYQWYFNGGAPVGTGTSLKLTSLRPQDVGAYTVVVGNSWGSVTSVQAMLNVIPPVAMILAPGVVAHAESDTFLDLEYAPTVAPASNWQPLAEIAMGTNTSQVFIERPPLPGSQRFYRAWQPAGVSQPPFLSMELIPAITLTNAIGSSVRIDGINQVGPTDAWFTLATVTVTPTSQIYFDMSAVGQPARLYRLITQP